MYTDDTGKAYIDIIKDRGEALINYYLSTHSRVFTLRFDVRYPVGYSGSVSNDLISQLMKNLVQYLKRISYTNTVSGRVLYRHDPRYIWVREQNTSVHPHYHVILLDDANAIQSGYGIHNDITRLWGLILNCDASGLIHICVMNDAGSTWNPLIISRTNQFDKQKIKILLHDQLGYLAKDAYKGSVKDGMRDFGMSRIHGNIRAIFGPNG